MSFKQPLRRDVIRAAAAGVFTTSLFTGRVRGANERISIGFAGAGGRSGDGLMVDFAHHLDCQPVAVCDPFSDRRDRRASQLEEVYAKHGHAGKGVEKFKDFREMVQRQDIDAIVIATPDHWHVPILIAAVEAGKDVYVEKPLSPAVAWNMAARDAVRRSGRIFQYGTQQRGASHVRRGCELVRSGAIGELTGLEVVSPTGTPGGVASPQSVPPGFDYEMWQGPAPERPFCEDRCVKPGHWHIYDYSIGFLGGWGAHPLDVLDWGLPRPTVPVEYEGTGLIPSEGLFNTVMDWAVRCTYANGLGLNFKTGPDSTTFTGTDGWIRISRNGIQSEPASLIADFPSPDRFAAMGRNHARNFLDSIRGQATPESPIDCAIRTDLISHLSNIAVRTGRKIRWDPVKETIVGDAEAQRMLDRPLRKPWSLK
ncbi:MAG: Gfo/Idh/MocA family oxidoreductase [Bryobacterales bacterium]|nr:Gfo/Idh/MocA family oxidoreductase [Bryobacterales bacterium]